MPNERYRAAIDHLQQAIAILGPREERTALVRLLIMQAVELLLAEERDTDRKPDRS